MGKLIVAVIGCGGIANQKHFPALKNNADLNEIVAFCDIKIERAQEAAEKFGAPNAQVTADYREVLANPEVEVVHICTPNVSHSEIAIAAFAAKKNVYCEKPMSHSTEEAEKMVEAWKKSGMQFTVGYQNRFRPEVQNLHAACQKGDLGDIYYAKRKPVDVDDEVTTLLKFENGTIGSCEATRMAWGRNNYITLEVHGTKGSISWCYERLNELNVCYGMEDQDGERGFKTIYTGPANPHGDVTWNIPGMNIGYGELKAIEMYEFGKAIVEGYQPSTNFGVGYRLDRVCDAILESNETGSWVKVK